MPNILTRMGLGAALGGTAGTLYGHQTGSDQVYRDAAIGTALGALLGASPEIINKLKSPKSETLIGQKLLQRGIEDVPKAYLPAHRPPPKPPKSPPIPKPHTSYPGLTVEMPEAHSPKQFPEALLMKEPAELNYDLLSAMAQTTGQQGDKLLDAVKAHNDYWFKKNQPLDPTDVREFLTNLPGGPVFSQEDLSSILSTVESDNKRMERLKDQYEQALKKIERDRYYRNMPFVR